MPDGSSNEAEVLRTFWHGGPLSQYQVLCLRSFVARGYRVEVFCYDDRLSFPDWLVRKDARQILPAESVLLYRSGPGRGSPSLHSNLFRYALLHQIGGWWIDADVVLLRSQIPAAPVFFSAERHFGTGGVHGPRFGTAVMKLPAEHPLLAEAIEHCLAIGESARWGETGPALFTELVKKYGLARTASAEHAAYPIPWRDLALFFDPARCNEAKRACKNSTFVHLWNEMWRRRRVPDTAAPPSGSFLDWLIGDVNFDRKFRARMQFVSGASVPRPVGALSGAGAAGI
jgi:hypothetical protein